MIRLRSLSSRNGEYVLPALPPGEYKLQVESSGFLPETRTGVILSSGQASTLNVGLTVAGATEKITVSEAPPLLQTANNKIVAQVPASLYPGNYVLVVRSLATGQKSDPVLIAIK